MTSRLAVLPTGKVRVCDIHDLGLSPGRQRRLLDAVGIERDLLAALMRIHGPAQGLARYAEYSGMITWDGGGDPLVPVYLADKTS